MSRHHHSSTGSLPSSPRTAAERRVLEQLAQQPQTAARRTLPRPAATSTAPVDPLPGVRLRRPRSRIFGASTTAPNTATTNATSVNNPVSHHHRDFDSHGLLTEILAEFPEIDATTVTVLLDMHNGQRGPVVTRLAEVYRRPGKEPQKRHSFPSSSPQELGRLGIRNGGATLQLQQQQQLLQQQQQTNSKRNRKSKKPFSVDRIDDSEDDTSIDVHSEANQIDATTGLTSSNNDYYRIPTTNITTTTSAVGLAEDLLHRSSIDMSSHSPPVPLPATSVGNNTSRSHTTSTRRRRSNNRSSGRGAESSGASAESLYMDHLPPPRSSSNIRAPRSRTRTASESDGGGSRFFGSGSDAATRETISGRSSRTSWTRREERVSEPLRPPWGQDVAPRPRGDVVPPVIVAPPAMRRNQDVANLYIDPIPGFPAFISPQAVPVVAEQSSVRLRGGPMMRDLVPEAGIDNMSRDDDAASVSSVGTASSNTTNPYPVSAPSSSRSSVRSSGRSGLRGETPPGRENSALAAAGALMRGLAAGNSRPNRNRSTGESSISRRKRASRSVKEFKDALKEKSRYNRESWSGEEDEAVGEVELLDDRGSETREDDRLEGVTEESTLRTVNMEEMMMTEQTGYVRVEVSQMQKLVRKVTQAEQALQERAEKVATLLTVVNEVRASLVSCDKRQQQRFDDMSERFTANNESIERLTNDMWRIKRMLHDYETRRSRRFWRVVGMLLLDALAYVGLFVVWICTSVYNLFARQRRAVARLLSANAEVSSNVSGEAEGFIMNDSTGSGASGGSSVTATAAAAATTSVVTDEDRIHE